MEQNRELRKTNPSAANSFLTKVKEELSFQQMILEQLEIYIEVKNINFNLNFTVYTKINSKLIINLKHKAIQLLEKT